MSPKMGLYGLIPASIAILFIAVAIGVNRWQYKKESMSKYIQHESYTGLWKLCIETTLTYSKPSVTNLGTITVKETSSTCDDIAAFSTQKTLKFISVVKYILFATLVCMVLAILGTLVKHFVLKEWLHEKQQIGLGYITAMLAFLTGVLAIAAFGVYGAEVKYEGYTLQAGFYLAVTAAILSWISAAMFLAGSICIGAKMYPDMK
ncbi:uncharacterized protein LOC123559554 [Mercenaria mercenaria]|uniref:uncharacterized protein LOC123559554 n=1 Tax=Mercenaria mercenaria TaxID=6596 RepID=UPI00234FA831|nr:uncharacterized protein LOC123559554 [Mercenaria mercenaria]XP_045207410.2 uncharacterized protein LOC123559554 [Mercenaria mercenaria]XP_045207412.2 uncharacterized protein LOC123559554 [Mercenaria mercenaria]